MEDCPTLQRIQKLFNFVEKLSDELGTLHYHYINYKFQNKFMEEYTENLENNLFLEGKEVEYFRDRKELLEKIVYYLGNEKLIVEVGNTCYDRLHEDGHTVENRVLKVIQVYNNLK